MDEFHPPAFKTTGTGSTEQRGSVPRATQRLTPGTAREMSAGSNTSGKSH